MHSTYEKIALIQCYIHHMKGVEVNINQPRNLGEVFLMEKLWRIATSHFGNEA